MWVLADRPGAPGGARRADESRRSRSARCLLPPVTDRGTRLARHWGMARTRSRSKAAKSSPAAKKSSRAAKRTSAAKRTKTAKKPGTARKEKPRTRKARISREAPPRPSAEPDRGPRHEPSGISNRPIGEERARQARVPARRTRKDPKETAMEMTAPMPVGESNPPDEDQNEREEVAAEHSSWMANPDAPFRRARRPAGGNARLGPGGGRTGAVRGRRPQSPRQPGGNVTYAHCRVHSWSLPGATVARTRRFLVLDPRVRPEAPRNYRSIRSDSRGPSRFYAVDPT